MPHAVNLLPNSHASAIWVISELLADPIDLWCSRAVGTHETLR